MKLNSILIFLVGFIFVTSSSFGQIRTVNSATNKAALSSSAFVDGSSDNPSNLTSNIGKGLVFPRTNLTTFVGFSGTVNGASYPTKYDGMIVYNSATGAAGIGSAVVYPGFYYYSNPLATGSSGATSAGEWVRIADQNDLKATPSGATLPTTPTPNPGDVFYNTTTKGMYYFKDTQWVPVSSTPNGSILPLVADSKVGDVFYETNVDPTLDVLKIFNGTAWVTAGVALDATGENYLTLAGQTLKANPINLSGTNATGILAAGRFPALTGDITTTAGSLATTLKSVGTAGTYKSVTTDAQGRVISGTNPTTLAGYGITDAASSSHNHALDGLSDVAVASKAVNDVLQWNGSKWVNNPIVTGNQSISFTPNAAGDVTGTATGATLLTPTLVIGAGKVTNTMLAGGIDLTTKVTGVLPIANIPTTLTGITSLNGLTLTSLPTGFSIAGGTSPKTLTVTDNASLSGTNTGDQTASSVPISAITGVTGTTVQAALADIKTQINTNASDIATKLTGNTAITPGTKTKITYDAKGLVTAGADATTSDIASSTDKRYVTDAQLATITTLSGTNTGDQVLSLAGSNLTISGAAGNTVTGIGDITGVTAGTGLSGGGTSGDVTLNLTTNAVGAANLKGSSGPLDGTGATTGFILQSNGDGTFSWKDITSGIAADPSSLSLGTGMFYIGDASSKASAISKNAIPLSGFGVAAASIDLGNNKITNLAAPTAATDAATKKYVDDNKIDITSKGVANGVVPLNSSNTIDNVYLPSSLLGAVNYRGVYDANTDSPLIGVADGTNKGYYYVVTTAGTTHGLNLVVGDWVISDGASWGKVASNSPVLSVFGRSGSVVANAGDYNTTQVTEATNLYYTDARVSANATVVGKEDKANKSTDGTLSSISDVKYPSEKAVKTYVDAKVPASAAINNGQVLTVNASGNPVWQAVSGTGTVTNVSVTANAGITGVVTNPTTTPAIALTLGNITPTSVTTAGAISGGAITGTTVSTTGTITGSNIPAGTSVSGTNTGDQQITLTGAVTGAGAAKTTTIATTISDDAITSAKILDGTIANADLATGIIAPTNLKNIAGAGTSGQILTSNGTGGFSWAASAATDLAYTASATNGIVTSSTGADATIPAGSTANASLMLPGDKTKLDGIAAGANNYVLPIAAVGTLGGIKVGANLSIDGTGTLSATSSGLAAINASSLLGNNTGSNAVPIALTVPDVKTLLSLTNVDNTTDMNKPISTLTQTALNLKQDISNLSNAIATDASSIVKYPSVKAIKDYVDTQISTGIPSATTTSLGVVQLAGDLGGTALSPAVATVGGSTAAAVGTATVLANNATATNTASTIVRRDASGNFTAGTITATLSGNATTATTATNATNTAITNDVATATSVYPTWVTANSGNMPLKVSSANLSFVPSTGTLTATAFSGSLNASNLASGSVPIARLGTAGGTASSTTYLRGDNTWATAGSGTVTSVGLSLPTIFTVSNSPVTATGTLTATLASESQATVLAAPSGAAGIPTFRALVATDVPILNQNTTGNAATATNIAGGSGGQILYQSAVGVTSLLTNGTNGQVLTSAGGAASPTWTTINSVSSVGLSLPSIFTVSNSPVTGSGTLTGVLASQSQATVLAAPTGATGVPTFRTLAASDIPTLNQNTTGNAATATTATTTTNITVTDDTSTSSMVYPAWVPTASGSVLPKVSSSKLSFIPSTGALTATSFNGAMNASNLTSGTLPVARIAANSIPVADIYTTLGTASASTYLRGDGTWATPPAGGSGLPASVAADATKVLTVDASGTPVWQAPASGGSGIPVPAVAGTNGQVLTSDAAGVASWKDAGYGYIMYHPSGDANMFCKATGLGVTAVFSPANTLTVTIPAGVKLKFFKVFTTQTLIGGGNTIFIIIDDHLNGGYNNDVTDEVLPVIVGASVVTTSPLRHQIYSAVSAGPVWNVNVLGGGIIGFNTANVNTIFNSPNGFNIMLTW